MPASRGPTRSTSSSTSSARPDPEPGPSSAWQRRRVSVCSTCSSCCSCSGATSPRTGSASLLYPDSTDEAFERMFERDKDDLRALGVPIEVGQLDAYFDDEPGYRIRAGRAAAAPDRAVRGRGQVVGLATKVWEHARLAEATSGAVRKLTAVGVPVDVGALDLVEPRLGADEPAFDVFWEAARDRQAVEFDYQRPGARERRAAARAVGRGALLRPLVRRRPRPGPRRGAGLPAVPGAGQRPRGRSSPGPTPSRRGSTSATWHDGSPRR